jgi:hypothetical protein
MSMIANRPKRGLDPDSAFKKWSDDAQFLRLVELSGVAEPPPDDRAHVIIRDPAKLRDYQNCRAATEKAFQEQLFDAQIIGSGIPDGGSGRTPIDPSLWDILEINYEFYEANGEDCNFKKLEFFARSAVPLNIRTIPKWLDDLLGQHGYNSFRHTEDYRHVCLHGIDYALSPLLANIVRILHLARLEDGHGWRNGKQVLELAGSTQLKMNDALKDRKDSKALIQSDGKGMFRLALEPPQDASEDA